MARTRQPMTFNELCARDLPNFDPSTPMPLLSSLMPPNPSISNSFGTTHHSSADNEIKNVIHSEEDDDERFNYTMSATEMLNLSESESSDCNITFTCTCTLDEEEVEEVKKENLVETITMVLDWLSTWQ